MSTDSYSTDSIPTIPFEYGMVIKDGLFEKLYAPQIKYWNERLKKISQRNVDAYARSDEDFNLDDQTFVAISVDGKEYNLLVEIGLEHTHRPSPFCLEMHIEIEEEMAILAGEINKLIDEQYLADRFLSGLCMYDLSPTKLREVLGDGLAQMCDNAISDAELRLPDEWPEGENPDPFIQEHLSIIEAMQQRVILNMITI